MNNDKNWLLREFRKLTFELQNGYAKVKAVDILPLIDQLDEPELLSQEWIDNNVVHIRGLGDIFEAETVENLLVPKQELPVIPQFVADWWERSGDSVTMYGGENIDKKRKIHLISNFNDRGLDDHLSKVEDWLDENESTFLDLVNGKVYEVEKEKLYYVLNKHGQTLLVFTGGAVCLSSGYTLRDDNKDKYQLTEKQIKDYDPRYWSFSEEVAE